LPEIIAQDFGRRIAPSGLLGTSLGGTLRLFTILEVMAEPSRGGSGKSKPDCFAKSRTPWVITSLMLVFQDRASLRSQALELTNVKYVRIIAPPHEKIRDCSYILGVRGNAKCLSAPIPRMSCGEPTPTNDVL
jgi:hypothetical protein